MSRLQILSAKDVRQCVSMPDAIELMRGAFADLSSGTTIIPQRIVMEMPEEKSRAIIMPAYAQTRKRHSTKIVTLSGNNTAKGLPFIQGLLLLFDSDSGTPLALMDASFVTALRTGAASGLATQILARDDGRTAMIFGAGAQARTQLEGIAVAKKLDRAFVYGPDKSAVIKFCDEMSMKLNLQVEPSDSPARVSEADIVCTATTSETPVFQHRNLKAGVHINGIGSYKPTTRELPSETVMHATIVVDSRSAAMAEAGDIVIPIEEGVITANDIHAELGEIILKSKPSRTSEDEITFFKSVGNAVQDLAIAERVFDVSIRLKLGKSIEL